MLFGNYDIDQLASYSSGLEVIGSYFAINVKNIDSFELTVRAMCY
jgi:hypothetical protein